MNASTSSSANSKPAISGKIPWKGGPSIQQNFSLPSTIIYYISKNPSTPTQYLKLAQSCKYFFEKLPILIAKDLYGENKYSENDQKCYVTINLPKLTSKIWFTNKMNITGKQDENYYSLLSSKIYRSEIHRIFIHSQKIIFNNFKVMASSAVEISLIDTTIIYEDGSFVTVDAILEALPNIEKFEYIFHTNLFHPSTLKNIANLKNLSKLQFLYLIDIPEISNVQDFLAVFKKFKNAKIYLEFDDDFVSDKFKNQLNTLIDAVIEEKTSKCLIEYNSQDFKKFKIMNQRFSKN